jgi:hypothetical protein
MTTFVNYDVPGLGSFATGVLVLFLASVAMLIILSVTTEYYEKHQTPLPKAVKSIRFWLAWACGLIVLFTIGMAVWHGAGASGREDAQRFEIASEAGYTDLVDGNREYLTGLNEEGETVDLLVTHVRDDVFAVIEVPDEVVP